MAIGKTKFIDMTEGSIPKLLITYCIPLLLGDFLQQLYNTADSIIVGNFVNKEALAAVGQSSYIVNAVLGLFLGISLGCTVIVSRAYGEKNKERLATVLDTIIKLTIILSVVFTIVGLLLLKTFLKLSGTTEDAYDLCYKYLLVYFFGISAQIFYNMFAGILRALGDSRRPLYVLAITCVVNIALDLFFIRSLDMGVVGAALATIISQYVSAAILWYFILHSEVIERPVLRKQKMDFSVVKEIVIIGIPYGLQRSIVSFSNTVVNSFINEFGSSAMAGWSVWAKLDQFSIATMHGMSSAVTTFIAQNIGAQKYERIRKGTRIGMVITLGFTYVYAIMFSVFSKQFTSLFNKDPEVLVFGSLILSTLFPFQPINSIQNILASGCRARGDSVSPMAVVLFTNVVMRQIFLHVIWNYYQDFNLILLSYIVPWFVAVGLMYIAYRRRIKKLGY